MRKVGEMTDERAVVQLYAHECRGDCGHWSDCAVHNEPAFPAGPCNCGANVRAAWTITVPDGRRIDILALIKVLRDIVDSVDRGIYDPHAFADHARRVLRANDRGYTPDKAAAYASPRGSDQGRAR